MFKPSIQTDCRSHLLHYEFEIKLGRKQIRLVPVGAEDEGEE